MAATDGKPWRWQRRIAQFTVVVIVMFVVLTLLGMALYPGGIAGDPATSGYSFTRNFFSDLGRLHAHNGASNVRSAALFAVALTTGGVALILYFAVAPLLFRARRAACWLAWIGSVFGMLAGAGFVGVALAPADTQLDAHIGAVLLAFRAFPVAVLFYSAAILLTPAYPRRYLVAYVVFGVLLVAYLALLTGGPGYDSPGGLVVQVVGQKIIVYAIIVCMGYQALGTLHVGRRPGAP